MKRLVQDGDSVYLIDEECMQKKEAKKQEQTGETRQMRKKKAQEKTKKKT